jgi:hypothetical protein
MTHTSYVGRCNLDRHQYFLLRVLPLLGSFLSMSLSSISSDLKLAASLLTMLAAAHFFGSDWERAHTTPFSEVIEEVESQNDKGLRRVIIENNERALRMIVFRERKDGGIQGILADFYIDTESGRIANEFLKIVERKDGEVDLVKVEGENIKLISDKQQVQRVFKQYFLK